MVNKGLKIGNFQTNCSNKSSEELAKDCIKEIKKAIKGKAKVAFKCGVGEIGYGVRPFGSGHDERERNGECLTTSVWKIDNVCKYEFANRAKMESFCKALIKEFDNVKGLSYSTDTIYVYGFYHSQEYLYISDLLYAKPCKEWNSLKSYLSKYGKGNVLKENEVYDCELFGKRGRFDNELRKSFLCINDVKCGKILTELRKARGSKDTLTYSVEKKDYYDEMDLRCSIHNETECYGSRAYHIKAEIKTPSGKVKFCKTF